MVRFVLFDALREVSYFEKFKCEPTPCTEPPLTKRHAIAHAHLGTCLKCPWKYFMIKVIVLITKQVTCVKPHSAHFKGSYCNQIAYYK